MVMIKNLKNLYIPFLMSFALLFGQKIVMNGTFDLDGDKMLEFIALELNQKKDIFSQCSSVL